VNQSGKAPSIAAIAAGSAIILQQAATIVVGALSISADAQLAKHRLEPL
jgi:hypothetical protein